MRRIVRDAMPGRGDQLGERVARFVVGLAARVGNGQDGDVDGEKGAGFIESRHGEHPL
jgi:hypothetical protein